MADSLKGYKRFVIAYLRELEVKRAGGNKQTIDDMDMVNDDDLLRKWLWIVSIVGAIAGFVALPFLLGILSSFLPSILIQLLWFITRFVMGAVLLIAGLTIYLTISRAA